MIPTKEQIDAAASAIHAANRNNSGLHFSELVRKMAEAALDAAEQVAAPTRTPDQLAIGLEAVAGQIRRWLEWHKAHRDKEHLITDGDTAIMSLPVPYWPNHAQFEAWIKLFDDARATLTASNGDGYAKALAALQTAHDACFENDKRDVLGMSHGPFSGVNVALGIVTMLERRVATLQRQKEELLTTLQNVDKHGYVTGADYDMVRAAITKAGGKVFEL